MSEMKSDSLSCWGIVQLGDDRVLGKTKLPVLFFSNEWISFRCHVQLDPAAARRAGSAT